MQPVFVSKIRNCNQFHIIGTLRLQQVCIWQDPQATQHLNSEQTFKKVSTSKYPRSWLYRHTQSGTQSDRNTITGDWVLIHGAAGGIGLSAIQIAKAFGTKVIATTTTVSNIAACRSFGADYVIDYIATPRWELEVKRITEGHGVDVVLDPVGLIRQSLKCAAWCARLVTIGFASGNIEAIPLNHVLLKNVSIVGLHWGAYVMSDPSAIPRVWNELFSIIGKGLFRGTTYQPDGSEQRFQGLEDIPRALRRLENKDIWGKAVVTIQSHRNTPLHCLHWE